MRNIRYFTEILFGAAALCIAAFALAGCAKDSFDDDFLDDGTVRLEVNGKTVFQYDDLTCQIGYNESKHEFRIHTDSMSDYYIVSLSKLPTSEGENVTGNLVWTDEYQTVTRNNINLKVGKIEDDGTIWLGSTKDKIMLVVRRID